MAVKTYKKTDSTKLSANFKVSEFSCHGNGCCSTVKIDGKLVEYLQKIRDHFGKSVTISSGYRCPTHNGATKNASNTSRHTKGHAADIVVKDVAPAEVAKYAESIGVLGIGLYETDKDGYFVHVDTRTAKSYWYGQGQAYRSTFGGATEEKEGGYTMKMRVLKPGCQGEDVKALQILLIGRGYSCGKSGADGDYGTNTSKAVIAYQRAKGLPQDGVAGEDTMKKLLGA